MNVNIERATNFLKPFLLQDIVIRTNKKVAKRGKLKLFKVKQYFIKLHLELDEKIRIYDIPYPFDISADKNGILTLNYKLSCLNTSNKEVTSIISILNTSNAMKIYDNFLYILPSE